MNLYWRGGVDATQYLYRAIPPLSNDMWTAIYTNVPPTSTNGFFADPGTTLSPGSYQLEAVRP
jgi:hypothetical protein